MEFGIFALIVAGAVFIALIRWGNQREASSSRSPYRGPGGGSYPRRTSASWMSGKPPAALGVAYDHPARSAAERLDAALGDAIEARVKYRVQAAKPSMKDDEWTWTWFELKRFFLLCALLRNVPMYSTKVDEAWHELLMFTREYESFCHQFCGAYIHHAPHGQNDEDKPDAGSRAWFDWVYSELYGLSASSGPMWGAFYRTPLTAMQLSRLERLSEQELRDELFRSDTTARHRDLDETVTWLIARAKQQAAKAFASRKASGGRVQRSSRFHDNPDTFGLAAGGLFMYYSVIEPDRIEQRMDYSMNEQDRRHSGGSCTSGCSSGSDNHSRHHHDGGSSCGGGGSSCSSGGSSCGGGGGCGGGGD